MGTTKREAFQVVRRDDIELGKPLRFAVYDEDRNLLLSSGMKVTSARQLEALLERGVYRSKTHHPSAPFPSLRGSAPLSGDDAEDGAKEWAPRDDLQEIQDVKFAIGDVLQLQPQMEGLVDRYSVHVVGSIKSKSLMVSAPLIDGKLVSVRDGQTFMVRAFSGLNVYAFRTKVLKYQYSPFPYLHLSYPKRVHGKRVRKALRASASIIVSIHEEAEGGQIGAGKIVDISMGGARVLSTARLGSKDQPIWLAFKVLLGDIEEYVKTRAIVRTEGEELGDDGRPVRFHGVEFEELNQTQKLLIMSFVYQQFFLNEK